MKPFPRPTPKPASICCASDQVQLVLTDLKLPGMSGLEFLQAAKRLYAAMPVIVMTAYGTVETAVEAMKAGASDYVLKPFSLAEMRLVVQKELDVRRLREENRSLREALGQRYNYRQHGGAQRGMQEVLALVERVAPTPSTVLLGGESGVGKDLIARVVHQRSSRASGPFIKINSTAIPENLLESELFGYEKGAFTGATTSKPGKFELADKGTLFLDEIGDVPPATQVKLLRVLQEREFERLGGTRTLKVDVRLIAATNRDLRAALEQGTFREDLYYRLNVVPIDIPPLREHKEDIPGPGESFSGALRQGLREELHGHHARSDGQADRVSLAGQRARTGKHRRAGLRARLPGPRSKPATFASIPSAPRSDDSATSLVARGQDARSMGRRNHPRSLPPRQRQQEPGGAPAGPLAQRPALSPGENRHPRRTGKGSASEVGSPPLHLVPPGVPSSDLRSAAGAGLAENHHFWWRPTNAPVFVPQHSLLVP